MSETARENGQAPATFLVDRDVLQAVLAYLGRQPYAEVAVLVAALSQARPLEPTAAPAEPAAVGRKGKPARPPRPDPPERKP